MNYFNERAAAWDSNPRRVELAGQVARTIREAVPLDKNWSALDYGAGTGLVSIALSESLGRITLADNSEGMLAVLGEKLADAGLSHLRPIHLDLTSSPPPADKFDLIFSSMALHHVPDTKLLLGNFRRLLSSGGWLALADLDAEDGTFHEAGVEVHHGFDRNRLAELVRSVGFKEVSFRDAHKMEKQVDGRLLEFPIFLLTARN